MDEERDLILMVALYKNLSVSQGQHHAAPLDMPLPTHDQPPSLHLNDGPDHLQLERHDRFRVPHSVQKTLREILESIPATSNRQQSQTKNA